MNGGNVRSLYHAELGRSVLLGAHGLDFPGVDCCFVHMGPIGPTLLEEDDGEISQVAKAESPMLLEGPRDSSGGSMR